MKEKLYTIPVNEGFEADDECPFCAMERAVERSAIRYVAGLGASDMEPDVRAATDKAGFCREHIKKLYDYLNASPPGAMSRAMEILEGLHPANPSYKNKQSVFRQKGK